MGEDPPLTPVRLGGYESDELTVDSPTVSELDTSATLTSIYTTRLWEIHELPTRSIERTDAYRTAPQPPPFTGLEAATNSPTRSSKSITRKPVERRTLSQNDTSSAPRRGSPIRSATTGMHLDSLLIPPRSRTDVLFNQASTSLTSLARSTSVMSGQDNVESPPPYSEPSADSVPRGDVKQQNAASEFDENGEPPDAISLVRENRLDLLQMVLDRGLIPNDLDPITKRTAIIEAANLHRFTAARMLIQSGCRLHLKDIDGWTALHFAAYQGDVEICRLLLNAGAQLDEYSNKSETPLLLAARGGHSDAVQCLLHSWASQMSSGTSLLNGFLAASRSGSVRTVELFVERGINPKKVKDSWRPVCFAAQSGSIPMIDFMISHKCNIKQRDRDGKNALHYAAELGHTGMVEKLLALNVNPRSQTNKSQETPLHLAALGQHTLTAIPLILDRHSQNDTKDGDGVPVLHHCARNGDMALTTTLLNKGVKLEEESKYGWTAMLLVCAYGHLPLVMEFITRGVNLEQKLASPSFKSKEKTNEAARKGYWAEIRWPHPGTRPLHLALEFGQDEVANTLIAAGAKIDEGDSEGWRPLHYAAFNARVQMVEMLLNRGASPHATTNTGNTPLSLGFRESGMTATYDEKLQVCELLQAAMNAHKKSKIRRLSDFVSVPRNKSKEVAERNKIWHTAQLAEALYASREPEEEGYDVDSLIKRTSSNQQAMDDNDIALDGGSSGRDRSGSLRLMKTMTD